MKKYISVIMLSSRAVFYKLLVLMGALFAAQWVILLRLIAPYREGSEYLYYSLTNINISEISTGSKWIFYAVLLLFCVIASLHGSGAGAQLTIKRLRISETNVVILWGIYYTLCLLFLWCAQAANLALMFTYAEESIANLVPNEQSVLTVFYSNDFFHSCLPLADGPVYTENILMFLSLGMSCSYSSWLLRRGKRPTIVFFVIGYFLIVFNNSLGNSWGVLMITVIAAVTAVACVLIRTREVKKLETQD